MVAQKFDFDEVYVALSAVRQVYARVIGYASGFKDGVSAVRRLKIPDWIKFADLRLEREQSTGLLLYAPGALMALCRFNGMDPIESVADEGRACSVIAHWYCVHRQDGGTADPIAEIILADIAAWEAISIAAARQIQSAKEPA